jgi:hypothetical protein
MIYSSKVKLEFEFEDPCLCNAWVATAVIGAGVLGAGATIFGASKAADAQTAASQAAQATNQRAQDIALGMYNTTRGDLAPFRQIGQGAGDQLTSRLSELTSPISVNPDDFKNSDMYKFAQTQGERAVANTAAARGLGTSGAALKGAAAFESGLNLQNWQQNFNNQVTNQTNAYNRLKGLVDTGENASAQTGSAGTSAANTATTAAGQIGSAQTQAGTAQAAAANATGGALSGLANNIGGYAMAKGLYGNSSGSSNTNLNLVTDA